MIVAATSAASAVPSPQVAQGAQAASAPVRIGFDGSAFVPAVTRVTPGTTIEFTNDGSDVLAISDAADQFDLSPIPAGGGSAIVLPSGTYEFADLTSGARGRLLIGTATFGGSPTDPVADHIPDAWFAPEDPASQSVDPVTGLFASTSRLRVRFVPGTSVADAEAVLGRAGAVIRGGFPSVGLLGIEIAGTADHAAVRAAADQLRAEPAVEHISRVAVDQPLTLPPPNDELDSWSWSTATSGSGGNWGLEISRFPQAWNLTDEAARAGASVTTLVIDGGFYPNHVDMGALDVVSVCFGALETDRPEGCTSPDRVDDHGTHVAGTIGATHEYTGNPPHGIGVEGANPFAQMVGVAATYPGTDILQRALDLKLAGDPTFADLRVVNYSMSDLIAQPTDWAKTHRSLTCGLGPDDDDLVDGSPCLPWTDDENLRIAAEAGAAIMPTLRLAALLDVAVVAASGNSADDFCVHESQLYSVTERLGLPCTVLTGAAGLEIGRPSNKVTSAFAAASAAWTPADGPNPVFTVDAIGGASGASTERGSFSQVDGTVSAPGVNILSSSIVADDGSSRWEAKNGTSMATPHVTGLISYLLAIDPSLDVDGLRAALATIDDVTAPFPDLQPAPRIDAFTSVLRLDGMLEALLDVNDPSLDGNRRVVRGPGNTEVGLDATSSSTPGFASEPDGVIDMRDFRRYRDAWIQNCTASSPSCSGAISIGLGLDGDLDHPKRDLNLDGCVAFTPGQFCPVSEHDFPRVDFNGDGYVHRTLEETIEIDNASMSLTDLGVLATRFTPAPEGEGWYAAPADLETMLDGLLLSGDVEVNVGGLVGGGATDLEVELRDAGTTEFVKPLADGTEAAVLTIPAGRPIELIVRAMQNGVQVEYTDTFDLLVGQDVRWDPCGVIRLSTDADTVSFSGTTSIAATLDSCDGSDVTGIAVGFAVTRNGLPADAAATPPVNTTDADGVTTTTFAAGTTPGTFLLTATADLPTSTGTTPVEASIAIDVTAGYVSEIVATGPSGTFGTNPSIAADGNIFFTSKTDPTGEFDQLYRADDTGLKEIGSHTRSLLPSGSSLGERVDVVGARVHLRASYDNQAANATDRKIYGYGIQVFDGGGYLGSILAQSRIESPYQGPLTDVGLPTANSSNQMIIPIQQSGDLTERLADVVPGPALSPGPMLGIDWPRLADDFTSVGMARIFPVDTNAGGTFRTTAIVAGLGKMGSTGTALVTPIAVEEAPDAVVPTGWTLLGNKPDISASGDVVAFVGDHGDGPSVYVSVRVDGSFTEPVAITGPGRAGLPEVAIGDSRQHLVIDAAENDHNINVGVIHHAAGAAGLAEDRVIVAIVGRPEGDEIGGGLYTIPIELTGNGTPLLGDARPVIEIGDQLEGSAVTYIGWHRVLNSVMDDPDPDVHQLAFWVRTESQEHIIRAVWEGIDDASPAPLKSTLAAPTGRGTAGALSISAAPTPMMAAFPLPGGSTPSIPALIVSDMTPDVGATLVVTNRSTTDGAPAFVTFDYPGAPTPNYQSSETQIAIQPDTAGPFTVSVTTDDGQTAAITVDVQTPAGVAPTVDPGGPYSIDTGEELHLDASGSSDGDGTIASAAWDLDGDGNFDDASGITPTVPWNISVDAFCGGTCTGDGVYSIGVQVSDNDGLASIATTTVTVHLVIQDFTLELVPADQLINPGSYGQYRLEVGAVGGFTGTVSLSVDSLPAGYSASLARSTVTAPGSTTLNVTVPQGVTEATVPIVVRGTSGALTHDTTGAADVVFGLIPICFEPVSGILIDAETGAPIAAGEVRLNYSVPDVGPTSSTVVTGADGRFVKDQIAAQNPVQLTIGADGYHGQTLLRDHRCGDPIDEVVELVRREYATVRGRVVVGVPDPADTSANRVVAATTTGVAGAQVFATVPAAGSSVASSPTPADGTYLIDDVPLPSPDNTNGRGWISANLDGYWLGEVTGLVYEAGPAQTVDIPVVPACTVMAGATGRVTDPDGNPLAGRDVRLLGSGGPPQALSILVGTATTDADGRYDIPLGQSYLGFNNSASSMRVVDGAYSSTTQGSFTIDRCGAAIVGEVDYVIATYVPPPVPVKHTTSVTGRLVDAETGEPVRLSTRVRYGSTVGPSDVAGLDGIFEISNVLVGYDETTLASNIYFEALESISQGYRGVKIGPFTVSSGEVYNLGDVPVSKIVWSGVHGRVTDIVTGEPIANATVNVTSSSVKFGEGEVTPITTDADGYYEWNHLTRAGSDDPFTVSVTSARFSEPPGENYWNSSADVQLLPGQSVEQNYELLRVCEDVTVRGVVVNAVTREPIAGAKIVANNYAPAFSDADGRFLFEHLRAGSQNLPSSIKLVASATGFVTQTRYVTAFCGATLTVNFGVDTGVGSVFGTVTDDTGAPIDAVFIGSEVGGSDTTGTAGTYRIDDVPLGLDGGPTDWSFTAIHPDGRRITSTATVTNGGETELNFVFPTVVVPVNTPPTADDLTATVTAGESVGITLTGADLDGDPLTFAVVAEPAVGSLSGAPPGLTYTAPAASSGEVTFTYLADDGEDQSAPATVTVTIQPSAPADRPPTLAAIDNVTMDEGATRSVDISATDLDGDPIALTLLSGPTWASLTDLGGGSGTVALAPGDDAVETITVQACAAGLCDSTSFEVTVLNVAPTVTIQAPATAAVGETVAVTGTGVDVPDDTLTYQVDCGDGTGYGASQPSPEFQCQYQTVGPYTVSMRVLDDDGGEGSDTTTIDVTTTSELSVSVINDGPSPWGTDILLTAEPHAVGVDQPIMFRWDFDGDGSFDTAATSGTTITTQYSTPGTRTAVVEACAGAVCSTGDTAVEVVRRPATIAPPSGARTQYGDSAQIATLLTDAIDGTPIDGRQIAIIVAGSTEPATTAASGAASIHWTSDVGAGLYSVTGVFDGDDLYESATSTGSVEIIPENAELAWVQQPIVPASSYDVRLEVREEQDQEFGDIARAAVTFWIDVGCDGDAVNGGVFGVDDGTIEGDGVGEVVATIPGLDAPGCVVAELTSLDGTTSSYYTAPPLEARVDVVTDGKVTGGGTFDTPDGRVSVGFVAHRKKGVLSGHVEVVVHSGCKTVQMRSDNLTGLTIVDEGPDGFVATITGVALRKIDGAWIETDFVLVARDGGKGKDADSVSISGLDLPNQDSFQGQVVVHH